MRINELLNEKSLQRSDLVGDPRKIPRLNNFISKIKQRDPFKTEIPDDPEVIIKSDPVLLQNLAGQVIPLKLPKEPDGEIPLSKLTKTAELGGKEAGFSLKKEAAQRESLDIAIKENLGGAEFITLNVGNSTVNAAGAKPSKPGVKSDITIIDESGNDVAWISVKDGQGPRDFGQWGGVTHAALANNEQVQSFKNLVVDVLKQISPKLAFPKGRALGIPISDQDLADRSVFGKEFGGPASQSNVDLVLQGEPQLTPAGNGVFTLTGTHIWTNGDTPSEDYEPMLIVRYGDGRNNFGIKNARFSVYPTGGRRWIDIEDPEQVEKWIMAMQQLATKTAAEEPKQMKSMATSNQVAEPEAPRQER